jgi:hypothetical protein
LHYQLSQEKYVKNYSLKFSAVTEYRTESLNAAVTGHKMMGYDCAAVAGRTAAETCHLKLLLQEESSLDS